MNTEKWDIVERLRRDFPEWVLYIEYADEITRLRAEVARLKEALEIQDKMIAGRMAEDL